MQRPPNGEAKPARAPNVDPHDLDKRAALRRTRAIATGALGFCFAIFLLAKLFEPRLPWLGYIAAFAEAATIGGLADWYAVVALFRRPLGLPIPHTAIIPENRERIADNLGRFIEANFLAPEPVRRKLGEVDFARLVSDWLVEPKRADDLAAFVVRLFPQMLSALVETGLRDFVSARIVEQLRKVDLAPFAADLMSGFVTERRHQHLLDAGMDAISGLLMDEATLASLRDKIGDELPTLFKFFRGDAYLLKRIVASAAAFLEEVKADVDHPVRAEFDRFAIKTIDDLRHAAGYSERVEQLKLEVLNRPELRTLGEDIWRSLRAFVERDTGDDASSLRGHLATMLVEVGRHLADDGEIRADMNEGFVAAFSTFIESQKGVVSTFIADQVKGWEMKELVRIIELNVGQDLQYIRFNGMLIGGLAGIFLYAIERLLIGN